MQDLGGRNLNLGSPSGVAQTNMPGRPASHMPGPLLSPTYGTTGTFGTTFPGTSVDRDESPSRQAELLGRRALDKLANVRKALRDIEFQGNLPPPDWQPQTPGRPSPPSPGMGPISFDFSGLTGGQPLAGSSPRPEGAQGAYTGTSYPGLAASPLRK